MFCKLAFLKMLFLEYEINLELVNIFLSNLKNGLIKLAKGAPMVMFFCEEKDFDRGRASTRMPSSQLRLFSIA